MTNKIKTLSGSEAFKAIEGRTIFKVEISDNSVNITFTDESYINIEGDAGYIGCYSGCESYCYCSRPDVEMTAYFSEKK